MRTRTQPDGPADRQQAGIARRDALRLLAGLGAVALAGCATNDGTSSSSAASSSTSTTDGGGRVVVPDATCTTIPEETAGPFPADGSNGPNILTEPGVVRRDITSSFGAGQGVADGVPLTITLRLTDTGNGCSALAGAAVYLWHCDIDGLYSMYSQGISAENYLRGVQETGRDGTVTFTSIFPAAYSGRWPHIHFEVYPSLGEATDGGNVALTSQLALPASTCDVVYATSGYEQSVGSLARTSLDDDNVFGDGSDQQLATVTGSVDAGFVAELTVPV